MNTNFVQSVNEKQKIKVPTVVERLEKSTPLIFDEIARWRGLLWDDYVYHKHEQEQQKKVDIHQWLSPIYCGV